MLLTALMSGTGEVADQILPRNSRLGDNRTSLGSDQTRSKEAMAAVLCFEGLLQPIDRQPRPHNKVINARRRRRRLRLGPINRKEGTDGVHYNKPNEGTYAAPPPHQALKCTRTNVGK